MRRGGRPAIWRQDWDLARGPGSRLSPRSPVLLLLMLRQEAVDCPSASGQWERSFPDMCGPAPSQFHSPLCFACNVYGSNSRSLDLTNNLSCFEENESLLGMFLPRRPDRKEGAFPPSPPPDPSGSKNKDRFLTQGRKRANFLSRQVLCVHTHPVRI